jgi:Ca2+-binding EF-hand superfamily protein
MKDEAALRAMFEQFDAQGSGFIGQKDFTALIKKLGLRLSDAKGERAFLALDADQDGRIQFEELSVWWFKYDRPRSTPS